MKEFEITEFSEALAEYLGYEVLELSTRSRKFETRIARQKIMAFMYSKKDLFNLSLEKIGTIFKRDHATVLNAIKVVANECETNKIFNEEYGLFIGFGNSWSLQFQARKKKKPEPEPVEEPKEFMDKHSL